MVDIVRALYTWCVKYLFINLCHGQLQHHQHAICTVHGHSLRLEHFMAFSPKHVYHRPETIFRVHRSDVLKM